MVEKKASSKTTKSNISNNYHRTQETYNPKSLTQARTTKTSDTQFIGVANYNPKGITQARGKSPKTNNSSGNTKS